MGALHTTSWFFPQVWKGTFCTLMTYSCTRRRRKSHPRSMTAYRPLTAQGLGHWGQSSIVLGWHKGPWFGFAHPWTAQLGWGFMKAFLARWGVSTAAEAGIEVRNDIGAIPSKVFRYLMPVLGAQQCHKGNWDPLLGKAFLRLLGLRQRFFTSKLIFSSKPRMGFSSVCRAIWGVDTWLFPKTGKYHKCNSQMVVPNVEALMLKLGKFEKKWV